MISSWSRNTRINFSMHLLSSCSRNTRINCSMQRSNVCSHSFISGLPTYLFNVDVVLIRKASLITYEITEKSLFYDPVHNFVNQLLLVHHSLNLIFVLEKTFMRSVIIDRNVISKVRVNFARVVSATSYIHY